MSKNRIISQMFDVKPVDETGDLDWKKIQAVGLYAEKTHEQLSRERNVAQSAREKSRLLHVSRQEELSQQREDARKQQEQCILAYRKKQESIIKAEKEKRDRQRATFFEEEKLRLEKQQQDVSEKLSNLRKEKESALILQKTLEQKKRDETVRLQSIAHQQELKRVADFNRKHDQAYQEAVLLERERREQQESQWLEEKLRADALAQAKQEARAKAMAKAEKKKDKNNISWQDIFSPPKFSFQFDTNKYMFAFASLALVISLSLGGVMYASKGLGLKGRVLGASTDGLENLNMAMNNIKQQNFEGGAQQFDRALANFSQGSSDLESMGGLLIDATRFVPFASKLSSGKNAIEAGKHFSAAGKSLNEIAKISAQFKNGSSDQSLKNISLLDILKNAQKNIAEAKIELDAAQKNIDLIAIDDLPIDKQNKFLLLKKALPDLRSALDFFLNNSQIFADLLGGNGPRKYLFLFQNNAEMRATGGFIGSYGLLDVANGHVKKFFIDGIFNPDGQLKDKIVPPIPIQKISATWSMHDSNWFADFPVSARKAIQFYEKTGGPTADGVITLTPTVMQKLLEITGPIDMPEYDVTLDSKNFIELTQNEVEVEYDKQENKPKKILSDLAPLVLEKLLSSKDLSTISRTAAALLEGLNEKHILLYSENAQLKEIISKQGWSGEILETPKDYLSVINTNVNGYKTDAVMEEKIEHLAQIQADGSIVDTVTVVRKHSGGSSAYEWFNKVNADYMRIYVPLGSKLLEVSGQTREVGQAPLDYDALGFARDSDVQKEEENMAIDPTSGTRIYNESGKTVFANWVYTSPQETTTIVYKYQLPFALFKISIGEKKRADSYSLVAQKQSGSVGSAFVSRLAYLEGLDLKWNLPSESKQVGTELKIETKLDRDRFFGAVFEKK